MYSVAIITISDKGSQGMREDLSGPAIAGILVDFPSFQVSERIIIPDERPLIEKQLIELSDIKAMDLILTTGGTGFSHRDVTPEATLAVVHKRTPGIPEAMRHLSLEITPRAMLSRAEAGIRGDTLIINLPGSPKAVKETLAYVMPSVEHGLDILKNKDSDCGAPES